MNERYAQRADDTRAGFAIKVGFFLGALDCVFVSMLVLTAVQP